MKSDIKWKDLSMLDCPSIEQYDKIKYNFRMYMEMGGNIYYEKKKQYSNCL